MKMTTANDIVNKARGRRYEAAGRSGSRLISVVHGVALLVQIGIEPNGLAI
jgi:hypothetical protein